MVTTDETIIKYSSPSKREDPKNNIKTSKMCKTNNKKKKQRISEPDISKFLTLSKLFGNEFNIASFRHEHKRSCFVVSNQVLRFF
jgi:hypothetical protein